ncbi:Fe-S cluster assembly ATPase SufC [Soehngenia longivitae]|uniref:Fe-S cluster assembly ATPase SufC n=1 Tax=Soehngenia longivitae TaxID=2562294 RepID=A0A4Z0D5N5_9FIRM|nr:Fe-S cluster assembly ATPase SufC [Soehngenia longivitae]TFZ40209.1 Fe-S cluster assembly ATPase SufC [Soehngenia longivitae]
MSKNLLTINDLKVEVADDNKEILKGINLKVNKGEIHVIMGPNGGGKSTLAYTLMGHPKYKITNGEIIFCDTKINDLKTHQRAKMGLFLSFQYPEEIEGVTVEEFLRTAKTAITDEQQKIIPFKRLINKKMEELSMNEEYASRYLNVGFSGGEKKKNEILQMSILNPKLSILDETDSGLDVDAIKIVAEGVNKIRNDENAFLIITHYNKLLEYIKPDFVHILLNGRIVKSGGIELADEIDEYGYEKIKNEFAGL